MPIPEFVAWLRQRVGQAPLWLPGATAVIFKDDPARPGGPPLVLLVRRSDNGAYTPVSGIVDPREAPHECARREAAEEASVVIEVERLVAVRIVGPVTYPNGDVTDYLDHTFRCRWVSGEPMVGDDESCEAAWWPSDALPPMDPRHAEPIRIALENPREVYLGTAGPLS